MRKGAACLLLTLVVIGSGWLSAQQSRPAAPKGPGLGVPVTPEQIAGADVSIPPDGSGLPPGSGTPAEGGTIYNAKCLVCHGPEGAGGAADRLVGGHGTLKDAAPVKTIGSYWPYATTLFDYIRRAMPYHEPHSLTDAEAYALTAYLLHLNGIVAADAVMDATSLPKVQMPNRANFVPAYPPKPQGKKKEICEAHWCSAMANRGSALGNRAFPPTRSNGPGCASWRHAAYISCTPS
jgi:cytochrome c